jgi:hypothetical protein
LNQNILISVLIILLLAVFSINGCIEQPTTNNNDYYFVDGIYVTGDINNVRIIDVTVRSYHENPYEVWNGFPSEWNSSKENKEGLLENPYYYLIAVNGTLENQANEKINSMNLTLHYYYIGDIYLTSKALRVVNLNSLDKRPFHIELSQKECGENLFWRINDISFTVEIN